MFFSFFKASYLPANLPFPLPNLSIPIKKNLQLQSKDKSIYIWPKKNDLLALNKLAS
jgi:hypothetical protein